MADPLRGWHRIFFGNSALKEVKYINCQAHNSCNGQKVGL